MSYQILKVLRSKTKILKFWPFGDSGGQTGAPNQNFSIDMKSGPQNKCHIKFWRFYVQKQKFLNFDLSGARRAKQGPRTKIFQLVRNKGPKIYLTWNFWGSSSNNKKFQIFDRFRKFFVKFRRPKSKFCSRNPTNHILYRWCVFGELRLGRYT